MPLRPEFRRTVKLRREPRPWQTSIYDVNMYVLIFGDALDRDCMRAATFEHFPSDIDILTGIGDQLCALIAVWHSGGYRHVDRSVIGQDSQFRPILHTGFQT